MDKNSATASNIYDIMRNLIESGRGHYIITCNDEYVLAQLGDDPVVSDEKLTADLGGYDLNE